MAPQQFADLERLNEALDLGMSTVQLRELFAGVQRRRGFRRRPAVPSPRRHAIDRRRGRGPGRLRDGPLDRGPPRRRRRGDRHRRARLRRSPCPYPARQTGGSVTALEDAADAAAFVGWMLDGVVAEARGDHMQTLARSPEGSASGWAGSRPEIVVQNSRLGERSERLEPCEVGVRLRPAEVDGRTVACTGASRRLAASSTAGTSRTHRSGASASPSR